MTATRTGRQCAPSDQNRTRAEVNTPRGGTSRARARTRSQPSVHQRAAAGASVSSATPTNRMAAKAATEAGRASRTRAASSPTRVSANLDPRRRPTQAAVAAARTTASTAGSAHRATRPGVSTPSHSITRPLQASRTRWLSDHASVPYGPARMPVAAPTAVAAANARARRPLMAAPANHSAVQQTTVAGARSSHDRCTHEPMAVATSAATATTVTSTQAGGRGARRRQESAARRPSRKIVWATTVARGDTIASAGSTQSRMPASRGRGRAPRRRESTTTLRRYSPIEHIETRNRPAKPAASQDSASAVFQPGEVCVNWASTGAQLHESGLLSGCPRRFSRPARICQ